MSPATHQLYSRAVRNAADAGPALNTTQIIGIAVAGAILLIVIIGGLLYYRRRKAKSHQMTESGVLKDAFTATPTIRHEK